MKKRSIYTAISILVLILLFFIDLASGSEISSISDVFSYLAGIKTEDYLLIDSFRFPRAITAILAGISLSLSGLMMQTIFRNPLAGPYILGISSGAGLGVALFTLTASFISGVFWGYYYIAGAAFVGAFAVLLIIFYVSLKVKDIMTLLVLGILISSSVSAIIGILQYFSEAANLKTYIIWTMGNLESVNKQQIPLLIILVLAGIFISVLLIKPLNGMMMGEEYAKTMGIDIKKSRLLVFASTGILTGTITAFCGPIGFVGIIVPHFVRVVYGTNDHKILIPQSIIFGAGIMLISDIISQLPATDYKLPVNSVTAILGIPVIIWMIVKNKRISL